MADKISKEKRSLLMSRIHSKDTGVELLVRKELHRRGFRFRLHRKDLPGTPDIVLPRYRTVVFVNGCFWHHHPGCHFASIPKSNIEFWQDKMRRNEKRDASVIAHLEGLGWQVITVWECETVPDSFDGKMEEVDKAIRSGRFLYLKEKAERKAHRERERDANKEKEASLKELSPSVPKRVRKLSEE